MVVATLFPLALNPEMSRLRTLRREPCGSPLLLASLLALEFLFREDARTELWSSWRCLDNHLTLLLLAKTRRTGC